MRQLTIDNKVNTLGGYLQDSIDSQTKVSVIADYFTIFALQKMQCQLAKAKQVRLLLTEDLYNTNLETEQSKLIFLGDNHEIPEKNKLRIRYVSQKIHSLIERKLQVRAAAQPDVIGSKIIVLEKPAEKIAINLSNSNLSSTGLGFLPSNKLFITNITNDEETADRAEKQKLLNELTSIKEEIANLRKKLKQEVGFNKKVDLNVKIKDLETNKANIQRTLRDQ